MLATFRDEQGTALVTSLFFILGLAVTATVIVMITGTERQVSYNEYSHSRSFHASDAGSERAINWIRTRPMPPAIMDSTQSTVASQNDFTQLQGEDKFKFDVSFNRVRFRPGWSREYRDYDYTIDSQGTSVQKSASRIEVRTSKLFRHGY